MKILQTLLVTTVLGASATSSALEAEPRASVSPGCADSLRVAETLNNALAAGDGTTVRALLLPELLVFESGGAENSALEYSASHLPADMEFLAGLKREQLSQTGDCNDSSAWVATRSRLTGEFEGKHVDSDSTETLTLRKTPDGWRIAHIHWSSAPHRNDH